MFITKLEGVVEVEIFLASFRTYVEIANQSNSLVTTLEKPLSRLTVKLVALILFFSITIFLSLNTWLTITFGIEENAVGKVTLTVALNMF